MSASIRKPLVVVLGATGSGKSKLALEISRLFNGEIISTDSMQIYKGLDIVTNKVTKEELQQCPHHMIDYLCPLQEHHNVVEFRDMALPVIDKILKSNKLPVIVGGTNYYIEALLWKYLINKQDVERAASDCATPPKLPKYSDDIVTGKLLPLVNNSTEQDNKVKDEKRTEDNDQNDSVDIHKFRHSLESEDSVVLHQKLMEVDQEKGRRTHPNDKRKIIRALEVYYQHGIEISKIQKSQKVETVEGLRKVPLRYDNTCVFWIQTEKQVLQERTDKRVDEMLEKGLIKELLEFHQQYNASRIQDNKTADYEHGIFQSIGFKEFHEYLILPDDEKDTAKGKKLLARGIEDMKIATRQYATRQVRWIVHRFLTNRGHRLTPVYGLDSTDVSHWKEKVYTPAVEILTSVLKGEIPKQEPIPLKGDDNAPTYQFCDACNVVILRTKDWNAHISGKKHKHMLKVQKQRQEEDEFQRKKEKGHTSDDQHNKEKLKNDQTEKSDKDAVDINIDSGSPS